MPLSSSPIGMYRVSLSWVWVARTNRLCELLILAARRCQAESTALAGDPPIQLLDFGAPPVPHPDRMLRAVHIKWQGSPGVHAHGGAGAGGAGEGGSGGGGGGGAGLGKTTGEVRRLAMMKEASGSEHCAQPLRVHTSLPHTARTRMAQT